MNLPGRSFRCWMVKQKPGALNHFFPFLPSVLLCPPAVYPLSAALRLLPLRLPLHPHSAPALPSTASAPYAELIRTRYRRRPKQRLGGFDSVERSTASSRTNGGAEEPYSITLIYQVRNRPLTLGECYTGQPTSLLVPSGQSIMR
ncbi:Protein of unknown function [Gryllus bimaculatus]|nr:Protein of unknown function [Gryllus bimaculatus]